MKTNLRKIILSTLFLSSFLLISNFSIAQNNGVEILENISNYSAGDEVSFTLSGSGVDLDKSDVSWSLGGKNILSGFGEKTVKIIIPKTETSLSALVTSSRGEKYKANTRISTKGLLLHFEATDSYVPSWYAGKKMLVKGGTARVYAYPSITNKGEKIKNSDINFVWSVDGNISKSSSGYGRDYFDVYAAEISSDNMEISVTAKPRLSDEEVVAVEDIKIVNTELLVYSKQNSLNRALFGTNKFPSGDFLLSTEPYFFSLDKKYNFNWTIGNRTEKGFSEKGFRSGKAGSLVNIKVKAEHVRKIFQEAQSELTLNF